MPPTRGHTNRLIAIGDIHGHANALRGLLEAIQPSPMDTIVTLGDCVNRGPSSREVLDCLLELQQACHVVSVLGNHDDMMLETRNDPYALERWMSQGGQSTLQSYGAALRNIPHEHWDLLASFVPFFESDNFIFTHANYCWYLPMNQQAGLVLRWLSLEDSPPRPHISNKTVILGHTPGQVRDFGHYRCIDTGCGFGGLLTGMDVQSGKFWQVNESGEAVSLSGAEKS